MRTLCVWYPEWGLRRSNVSPDEPQQVVGDDHRVVALNAAARRAGVDVGMRRREAEAVCPTVTTHLRDPGAEMAEFEAVAGAVEAIVPRIEVVAPGLLFAVVSGAVRYFGSEGALVDRLVESLETGFRIGLAAGPFAAQRAAELADPVHIVTDDVAFLASLDVATLDREELTATFRWLGIRTLGELAGLPREAVVTRFGRDGLEAHRLASGEDRRARPREIPPECAVEDRFDPPLEDLDRAAFAARAVAHRLLEGLGARRPHRVEITAESATGAVRTRVWRNGDPFDGLTLADRVRWQLRAWLESGGGITGGLVRLRIAPADLSDRGRQLSLREDAIAAAETYRALAQTQALVGPDHVLQARPQGGRDPVERVLWHRWGEEAPVPARDPGAPWPGRLPGPAPALVPPCAEPLTVEWDAGIPVRVRLGSRWEPVVSWSGPWRKMGRWWDGEGPADRYQIVTSAGAFLCEMRDGQGFLLGIYD